MVAYVVTVQGLLDDPRAHDSPARVAETRGTRDESLSLVLGFGKQQEAIRAVGMGPWVAPDM